HRSRSYRAPEHDPSLPPFRRSHFDSKASLDTPIEERYTQMSMKLYVGNLSYETSGENLRQHFTQAGTVETATVVEDRDTGRSRGFGFVEMATKEEGEAAIARFNGNDLNGRNLTVNVAKPRESRNGGRGHQSRGGPRPPAAGGVRRRRRSKADGGAHGSEDFCPWG